MNHPAGFPTSAIPVSPGHPGRAELLRNPATGRCARRRRLRPRPVRHPHPILNAVSRSRQGARRGRGPPGRGVRPAMATATAYTPPLLGFTADDDLDTVINWGLGADSTAYLARMLTDPAAHGIDLDRTVVLYMATGSEWPETRLLVDIGKSGYQNLRNSRVSGMSLPCCGAPGEARRSRTRTAKTPNRSLAKDRVLTLVPDQPSGRERNGRSIPAEASMRLTCEHQVDSVTELPTLLPVMSLY